ncbi:MAG TPA: hypothetical protein VF868_13345 [Bacteroidia bacterium]|jgi:hypothetical protein
MANAGGSYNYDAGGVTKSISNGTDGYGEAYATMILDGEVFIKDVNW